MSEQKTVAMTDHHPIAWYLRRFAAARNARASTNGRRALTRRGATRKLRICYDIRC
jgi:hypothetical protein